MKLDLMIHTDMKKNFALFKKLGLKGTVMQIEKALINDR